jgi:hypothetical protein
LRHRRRARRTKLRALQIIAELASQLVSGLTPPNQRDWVNDSEPEAEFQETVNQGKAMLKAVALAETFGRTQYQSAS